ncbi:MAG: hypothetical protein AB7R89_28250 [Dehalococcoidia bacterium]
MTTTTKPSLRARAAERLQQEQARRAEQEQQDAANHAAYLVETLATILREDFEVEPASVVLAGECALATVDGVEFILSGDDDEGFWDISVRDATEPESDYRPLYRRDSRFSRLDPWLRLGAVLAGEKGEPV